MVVFQMREPHWVYVEKEGIYLANLVLTDDIEIDLVKIPPKGKLSYHYHIRPNNGTEEFYFIEGNDKYIVIVDDKVLLNPKYVVFKSYQRHSVINLSNKDLIFIAVYKPPFKEGEVILCDQQELLSIIRNSSLEEKIKESILEILKMKL